VSDEELDLGRISVVVPTANERHNVERFLRSIPHAVEVVVVDSSNDGTADRIRAVRPERTVIIPARATIGEARQLGAAAAGGDLLVFSDADVRFGVAYFRRLARRPPAGVFFGPKRATESHRTYDRTFLNGQRLLWLLRIPAATGSNMGMRRAAFEALGGFRLDLPANEDTELIFRARHAGLPVEWRPDCPVYSLDDGRLDNGSLRKLAHSTARCALLLLSRSVPVPLRWLRSDWGYWRRTRPRPAGSVD
jgi:glycosyltransferase involved in cell wall biosynthesis